MNCLRQHTGGILRISLFVGLVGFDESVRGFVLRIGFLLRSGSFLEGLASSAAVFL
jgi:hypothetical protein